MTKVFRLRALCAGLMHIAIVLLIALVITLGSYAIVTRRNAPMDPKAVAAGQYSITGQYLVTLPCGGNDGNYDGSKPKLPEARGVPFNYNYYNPCDGHKILRDGFLKDVVFWAYVTGIVYIFYINIKRKDAESDGH